MVGFKSAERFQNPIDERDSGHSGEAIEAISASRCRGSRDLRQLDPGIVKYLVISPKPLA